MKVEKPTMSPLQRRRAQYEALIKSLPVPQHTSIAGARPVKAKPATGVMGSV